MLDQNTVTIGVFAAGAAANLIWTVVNLKIQNRIADVEKAIGKRFEDLKTWMDDRYVSHELARERQADVDRRLTQLEHRYAPLSHLRNA